MSNRGPVIEKRLRSGSITTRVVPDDGPPVVEIVKVEDPTTSIPRVHSLGSLRVVRQRIGRIPLIDFENTICEKIRKPSLRSPFTMFIVSLNKSVPTRKESHEFSMKRLLVKEITDDKTRHPTQDSSPPSRRGVGHREGFELE